MLSAPSAGRFNVRTKRGHCRFLVRTIGGPGDERRRARPSRNHREESG